MAVRSVPPQGLERLSKTRGKMSPGDLVPPPVPPSRSIDDPAAEDLLAIWAVLDTRTRDDLLAVARGLMAEKY